MNFIPTTAYHLCLNLPEKFLQPGKVLLVQPCVRNACNDTDGLDLMNINLSVAECLAFDKQEGVSGTHFPTTATNVFWNLLY